MNPTLSDWYFHSPFQSRHCAVVLEEGYSVFTLLSHDGHLTHFTLLTVSIHVALGWYSCLIVGLLIN